MSSLVRNESLRNIAIIAHVDHGKTTLVDGLFRQSGMFRADQRVDDRIMDSMELERERGITIAAKNCAVAWNGVRINIIDTPGHADFGGEVERALSMVDGVILLVDSSEGPLPQTRFVLRKALEQKLPVIAVINKIDRKDARPGEVLGELYDLFIDLDATDEQLEFPVLYAIGREAVAMKDPDDERKDLSPLFEAILEHIPGPAYDPDEPFHMLVADLDYSDYLGRLAVGRIRNGTARTKDALVCIGEDGAARPLKATRIQIYQGKNMVDVDEAQPGDIVVMAGIDEVTIGDTICTRDAPTALPRIRVDEPTVAMRFGINTSPLAGREGKIVQARKIRERLDKEALRNVSIRVEDTEDRDAFLVKGRGEFQMAIIVETMRREGFELTVGRPEVIVKEENGERLEPVEELHVDCDEAFMGVVTEKMAFRKGRMLNCINHGTGRVRLTFSVPSRGLIGYRDEFLTDTKGTGIMNSTFIGYEPWRGDFVTRLTGSLVADRPGNAVAYALYNLEPRGNLFVVPGDPVYEGMIVGEHNRDNDIDVNATKEKKLTNLRASGHDENIILTPVRPMTLEHALHFLREDELLEVTPLSFRLRKAELSAQKRYQMGGGRKRI
ncbi:MAG TPA: translational GTPase TypA [Candidatus Mailhella merdigallinarum]|uniref:Large ribosomal subunit assembly factor BipA n=1 Tax=Candidatus Mailhella merdigallinarum TaxID=2838658 RepID=A0A9D2HC56_9BACT|nr:translational GTPase TypA [Desulfovibrionaceae bacterium]PWM67020.1 MAG: translational GTPase TypA [Desulfovibrionaceae bacterium]HJA08428.1 translational GTPase TypA [Candidatus Mailhella merdigallinarum]